MLTHFLLILMLATGPQTGTSILPTSSADVIPRPGPQILALLQGAPRWVWQEMAELAVGE